MTDADEQMPLTGELAPPMANGDIVFEAPWQSRVFGMARALCEAGLYEWDDFRERLIDEISRHDEAAAVAGSGYAYFDHFLSAFEQLLADRQLCDGDELNLRRELLTARPQGHDH